MYAYLLRDIYLNVCITKFMNATMHLYIGACGYPLLNFYKFLLKHATKNELIAFVA